MSALPRPAQYLLRVDDLCPTVAAQPWSRIAALIEQFGLAPILAVVPHNGDPGLMRSTADAAFWKNIRSMQARGAAIALHGYRHLCQSRGRALVPLARSSEFAGVPEATQRAWIREGLHLLKRRGLQPQAWVAPHHGFDAATLRVLRAEGIHVLSDGLARVPFIRQGMTWIPQQLWAPAEKRAGLWTICIHPNTISEAGLEALCVFVQTHIGQFTSIARILRPPRTIRTAGTETGGPNAPVQERLGPCETAFSYASLWKIRLRRARRLLFSSISSP